MSLEDRKLSQMGFDLVRLMKSMLSSFLWILLLSSCAIDQPQAVQKHVIYLHGRIVELQGPDAVHPNYGAYEYQEIIDSLSASGGLVHYEVRDADTDFYEFANRTSALIDSLIAAGVEPSAITVVGASKGAVMAMQIAHQNAAPIRYVLLGANNEALETQQDWNLHGYILGIYETSDQLAGRPYDHWINRSTNAMSFEQLPVTTGLGHGFLYRPYVEWLAPTRAWMGQESGN